ncbi:MAG: DUF547 domain-containing protein [bacterium]|nr:DUF547 domain-containing protein [bacterium]
MLIPKGRVVHENLSTAFTHIDQFVEKLQGKQFSGFCHVSFWEYDGILFFDAGRIVYGIEEQGMRTAQTQSGPVSIKSILAKGHEKDGEISIYQLPAAKVESLLAAMNASPKYEELSTDLTSLDRVISLLKKERLSGFIEVLLEEDAGTANLFFMGGDVTDILIAPPDNQMIGEASSIDDLDKLCEKHGAVFNVYQSGDASNVTQQGLAEQKDVPQNALRLFEMILIDLEEVIDRNLKKNSFQSLFKKILPQFADSYSFLDPFIGDFKYNHKNMSYSGEASYGDFVDGLCQVIAGTVESVSADIPKDTLLPQLSRALESVSTMYPQLVEQLELETRLPDIFKDYSFLEDAGNGGEQQKSAENRKVLNLQGIGVSDIGVVSIMKEFYRVISAINEKYVDPQHNVIQYSQFRKSHEYQQYGTATAFLQQFDPAVLKTREQQLAFWLNIYNFLVLDGVAEFNIRNSVQEEKEFFTKTSYRLGEYLFSLDDIEHGILRNNHRRPYALFRQFGGSDLRQKFSMSQPDSRVHCCLCCATKSSPSLTIYMPRHIDRQLDETVTRYLLTNGMRVDRKTGELWLSRSFYWYRKDFESGSNTLLDFIIAALKDKNIGQFIQKQRSSLTLRFMDYNWGLNGK